MDFQLTDKLARNLARILYTSEIEILNLLSTSLATDLDSAEWATIKARQFMEFHRDATSALDGLDDEIVRQLELGIEQAASYGIESARGQLPKGVAPTIATGAMIDRIMLAASDILDPLRQFTLSQPLGILRAADDIYRQITADTLLPGVTGVLNRRQVTQNMINRYADRGVTTFQTIDGKHWHIDTYAEMAARTGLQRVAILGQTQTFTDLGYTVVRVSRHGGVCDLCSPWQDRLLSLDGQTGPVQIPAPDGALHTVNVAATLTGAMEQGLYHPNCKHNLDPYIPGYMAANRDRPEANDELYKATQHQRYLERQSRKWDRRAAAALDPETERIARDRQANYQNRIRQLVTTNSELFRLEYRETAPRPTTR